MQVIREREQQLDDGSRLLIREDVTEAYLLQRALEAEALADYAELREQLHDMKALVGESGDPDLIQWFEKAAAEAERRFWVG